MATMTSKSGLKKVFSGLSSIMIKKGGFSGDINDFGFDYDMPVTVDSLSFTQSEPTLNRTKIHGLQSDWAVTSTAGEVTFSATIPSIHADIVDWFLGTGAAVSATTLNGSTSDKFAGKGYSLSSTKLYAGVGLLSEDGQQMCIIKKLAIYATPVFENASTTPYAFKLTGSIEASDDASQMDIMFLDKQATV